MSGNDETGDKKPNPKDHRGRVDYGYSFHLADLIYKPKPTEAKGEVQEKIDPEPIVITVRGGSKWADRLITSMAVLISIVTAILLFFTVQYARKQWGEANRTADAAVCATAISSQTLELGRKEFAASEAAVLQPNISIRTYPRLPTNPGNPAVAENYSYIQIDIINSGRVAATKVFGKIIAVPNVGLVLIKNATVPVHSASPEYQTGFITRAIKLGKVEPPFFRYPIDRKMQVRVSLSYWNGVEDVRSDFCYADIADATGRANWQDCEFQETVK